MAETDLIYSVKDVFEHERFKDKTYRIPDYQRGYKWTPENVRVLLNDIWDFKGTGEQFYCLQNITIIPLDGGKEYNVIDGQQRLTTLTILLCYLNEMELVSGKLYYEIRLSTEEFLKTDVFTRKCWSEGYTHKPLHQDEYYILNAAKEIARWFEEDSKANQDAFKQKLLYHTKLIVNEVTGNEYQTFSNLNGVRVNLDASDLIRAMLVTYSVKEGKENVDIGPYRVRMGAEIDSFASKWSNPELRRFYTQFLPEELARKSKELRFDYSEHPINLLYLLFLLQKKGEKLVSLASFEDYLKSEPQAFVQIKEFDADLQEWFTNESLYHFLGYLIFNYKREVSFKDIYSWWKGSHTRNEFCQILKKKASDCLLSGFQPTEEEANNGVTSKSKLLGSIRFNINTNWYVDPNLPSVLILNDILISMRAKSLNRIPVQFFKVNDEDREHISCQTPNEKELSNKERWKADLKELDKYNDPEINQEKFHNNIQALLKMIDEEEEITKEVKMKIIDSLTQFGLNSIGNIVLLNLSVNRGYGNSAFIAKRIAIINNYFDNRTHNRRSLQSKNAYIRPFTLKTFLSNLNDEAITEEKNNWTLRDIKKNAESIACSVESFINESL